MHMTDQLLQVLVSATADVKEGCFGTIIGVVGGQMDTCIISVSATDASVVADAETEIVAEIIAESCKAGESVIATVDATATVRTAISS